MAALLGMRESLQIFRNELFVRFRKIFVGDIAGLGLIFEETFELRNDSAQRHLSLNSLLSGQAEITLPHRLARRGHFRGGPAGIVSGIMAQPGVLARQTPELFRQTSGLLAQAVFLFCQLLRAGRRSSICRLGLLGSVLSLSAAGFGLVLVIAAW